MTSTATPSALYEQYAKIGGRLHANPDMELEDLRRLLEELHVVTAEPTDVTYEEVDAGGVPAILAKPLGAAADRVIVHSHGGGMVAGSAHSHRAPTRDQPREARCSGTARTADNDKVHAW